LGLPAALLLPGKTPSQEARWAALGKRVISAMITWAVRWSMPSMESSSWTCGRYRDVSAGVSGRPRSSQVVVSKPGQQRGRAASASGATAEPVTSTVRPLEPHLVALVVGPYAEWHYEYVDDSADGCGSASRLPSTAPLRSPVQGRRPTVHRDQGPTIDRGQAGLRFLPAQHQ
jgi:hypothetical protein